MKERTPISETQRGLAQPKINRQEISNSLVDAKGESTIFQTRRIEMADAKEFDTGNAVAIQAKKCTNRPYPGPCLGPKCATPQPCLIPPKCGTGPCKNTL